MVRGRSGPGEWNGLGIDLASGIVFLFPFFGGSFGPAEDGHANKGVWEQWWERLSSPVSRIHLEEDSAQAQVRALEILVQTRTRAMCAQISIAEAREKWKAS